MDDETQARIEEVSERLMSDEWRRLGSEAVDMFDEAERLHWLDIDFPCYILTMRREGILPRGVDVPQVVAIIAAVLAVQQRERAGRLNRFQYDDERVVERTEIPSAFLNAFDEEEDE